MMDSFFQQHGGFDSGFSKNKRKKKWATAVGVIHEVVVTSFYVREGGGGIHNLLLAVNRVTAPTKESLAPVRIILSRHLKK